MLTVADTGSAPAHSWVDPVVASALHSELVWHVGQQGKLAERKALTAEEQADNARTETALANATWVLNTLTRGRLHGAECWTEDYRLRSCEVVLRRSPVDFIDRVTLIRRCGREVEPLDIEDWCQVSANTISFCCNCRSFASSCGGCGGTVARIYYSTKSNLPPGTESLVAWLAAEYAKAATGQKCALPERISSVTRQGVSWTMLDPQDFLDKGLTGMGRVDHWITTVMAQLGRGTLIDPLRSDRVFSEQRPCGSVGEFGDEDPTDPTLDPFSDDFRINS